MSCHIHLLAGIPPNNAVSQFYVLKIIFTPSDLRLCQPSSSSGTDFRAAMMSLQPMFAVHGGQPRPVPPSLA